MVVIVNPFDSGGYGLAELTLAINILPNFYNRLGTVEAGGTPLFRREGITQRTAVVEQADGTLNLLPSVPVGGPATKANRETRSERSFTVPHIPHDDVILPQDIQGIRAFGQPNAADVLTQVMNRKLLRMRRKHDQTLEYMEMNALKGILKDGAGKTLFNWHTEFGISPTTVDFTLGTNGADIAGKCRAVLRAIETNLKGETMTGVYALVSPDFWDKFIKHPKVEAAFAFYAGTSQPLRNDVRKGFAYQGIIFEEYNATVTLSTGATEALIVAGDGVAFPLGTSETFATWFAPANMMETVNTVGLPVYAQQIMRTDGRGIDLLTESNPLPVVTRPALSIRLTTSN